MDIVEQLRKYECMCTNEQCRSCAAADEIERLRHKHVKWKTLEEFRNLPEALREIERLRKVLRIALSEIAELHDLLGPEIVRLSAGQGNDQKPAVAFTDSDLEALRQAAADTNPMW